MNDLRAQIEQLIDAIDNAKERTENNEVVDLTALEGTIEALCKQVTTLPSQEARETQPLIGELISKLDMLEIQLTDFKSRIGTQG